MWRESFWIEDNELPDAPFWDSIEPYLELQRRKDKMKILTHPRDKVGDYQPRFLLHIPIGMLIGIPLLGIPALLLFIRYEENEDVHTKDQAWKDYAGAICGAVVTELAILVLWLTGVIGG